MKRTARTSLFAPFSLWALPALASCLVGAALLGAPGCNGRVAPEIGADDAGVPPAPPTPDLAPFNGTYSDFPAAPIVDTSGPASVPGNAGDLFGPAGSGDPSGGPCLLDPEVGSLFPRNWLRLRFRFTAPSPQNLFELRLHVDNQANDLVVYTASTEWTMPADLWKKLTAHSSDRPLTVSIRGGELAGAALKGKPALGTTGPITIAPVSAEGTLVYWTTSGGTVLRGFKIGEETVHDVLKPAQSTSGTACIGCHSSTPDGEFVAFSQTAYADTGDPANIGLRTVDGRAAEPSFLSAAARTLLGRIPQQLPTFSAGHYKTGDHVALTTLLLGGRYEIAWTDLEARDTAQGVGWGVIARDGDSNMVAAPVWSHGGQSIAYVSTKMAQSGVTVTDGDLRVVPYGDRKGGSSRPVVGASDPAFNEFYPAFSPDDGFLAFSRLPSGASSYNHASTEIFVVPAAGGTATRLAANDPPACSGQTSPGVLNSWPKWAPEVQSVDGRRYYWISFSSSRRASRPQLYVGAVVVEKDGTVKTYKALYLWNQPSADGNHTAAWDVFKIVIG